MMHDFLPASVSCPHGCFGRLVALAAAAHDGGGPGRGVSTLPRRHPALSAVFGAGGAGARIADAVLHLFRAGWRGRRRDSEFLAHQLRRRFPAQRAVARRHDAATECTGERSAPALPYRAHRRAVTLAHGAVRHRIRLRLSAVAGLVAACAHQQLAHYGAGICGCSRALADVAVRDCVARVLVRWPLSLFRSCSITAHHASAARGACSAPSSPRSAWCRCS